MRNTARYWYGRLHPDRRIRFDDKARVQTRHRMFPQHKSLGDDYYHQAFTYWWNSNTLIAEFKVGLVVRTAHFFYLNDVAAKRLDVEDYDSWIEKAEASGAQPSTDLPVESVINNKKLLQLITNAWPPRHLRYLEAIMVHEPYQGGRIDNRELAGILGIDDIEEVRRALDCIRRKLMRRGFSSSMIW